MITRLDLRRQRSIKMRFLTLEGALESGKGIMMCFLFDEEKEASLEKHTYLTYPTQDRAGGCGCLSTYLHLPINQWLCKIVKERKRDSANAVPTNRNYTTELSTFGIIAGVNPAEVQWSGLALGPPPT